MGSMVEMQNCLATYGRHRDLQILKSEFPCPSTPTLGCLFKGVKDRIVEFGSRVSSRLITFNTCPHSNQHPIGAHFLKVHTVPPNHYQLGTKYSNVQTCGGLFAFKPQRSGSPIAISMPRIPLRRTAKGTLCLSRDEWIGNMW